MSFLRILATSDFHGRLDAFHRTVQKAKEIEATIVIVIGDITHFGSFQQGRELLSLLRLREPPVYFVPGNCDPPELIEVKMENIKSIHGICERIGEINFIGVGGSSPSPFNTPFELSEIDIATLLERTSSRCQAGETCLVTHSPPRNTKTDITHLGEHAGSSSIRSFIETMRPILVLCGHIHEACGIDKIGETTIVNPGPAQHGRCTIVDLNGCIKVKLESL